VEQSYLLLIVEAKCPSAMLTHSPSSSSSNTKKRCFPSSRKTKSYRKESKRRCLDAKK
jgi:hypothetical protein